ncbi:MAG: hypothetical protein PHW76_05445 [Alphaproteobacteria bacterium]|nr:hypothetical protein [Alphaproteobacteria bacterium]
MSLYWLFFLSLAIVGSFAYTAGMKFGAPTMSPFGYAVIMNVVVLSAQLVFALTAKYGFKVDVAQGINSRTIKFAILTGCGAAMVDLCFFLALRYGSVVSSQIVWQVGSILLIGTAAVLFWGEALSLQKALGVLLGLASLILITRASS